jgi:hypothetical protein
MYLEDLFAAADVRQRHHHLAVETAGAQQRRIEHVGTVGGGHHDHAHGRLEAVHLDQHLVQGLFALVVAATEAGAALAADGIEFVDEDDAGRGFLGLFEHVAHARGADADEHLDEVGTGNREEGHLGLAGDRLGQQGLAGTGRADQQHAARDAAAELLELGRVAQEVDHFGDFLLGLVAAGDVGEGDGVRRFIHHPRAALAEGEGAALAAALHLAHEEDPDADQQQHGEPGNEDAGEEGLLLLGLGDDLDIVLEQVGNHPQVGRRVGRDPLAVDGRGFEGTPWMTTFVTRPASPPRETGSTPAIRARAWRVLNWLNTVIRTMPITSQIAIFLNMLFKVSPLFPAVGISNGCDSSADRHALQTTWTIRQAFLFRASRYISALRLREAAGFLICTV